MDLSWTIALFAVMGACAPLGLTRLVKRLGIDDHPNHRSSHDRPTPKSGGIGFIIPFMAILTIVLLGPHHAVLDNFGLNPVQWIIYLSLIGIVFGAALGDDIWELSAAAKIAVQFLVSIVFTLTVAHADTLSVPGLGSFSLGSTSHILAVLWIVFFMNALNFMDGINGIAGGTAVIALGFLGAIALAGGNAAMAFCAIVLAACVLGFLPYNFPNARIFMGDTGSQSLGFLIATWTILGAAQPDAKISLYVVPLLYFPFLFDVILTLIKRMKQNKKIWHAHREHIYQLCTKLGRGHTEVSLAYYVAFALSGTAAYAFVNRPDGHVLIGIGVLCAIGGATARTIYLAAREENIEI